MAHESAIRALSALADPSRRAIVEHLASHPASVGEIAAQLPVTPSAVSQHLRVLREAGLVRKTPEGTRRIYRLDPAGIAAVREWLDAQWATALGAFSAFADQDTTKEQSE